MIEAIFKCFNNLNPNMSVLFSLLLFTVIVYISYKIILIFNNNKDHETIKKELKIQKEAKEILADLLRDTGAMNACIFLFHNGKRGMHLDLPFFYFSPYSEVRKNNAPSMFRIKEMPIGAIKEHIIDATVSNGIYIGGGDVFVWSEDISSFDHVTVAVLHDEDDNLFGFLLLTFCNEYENHIDDVEFIKRKIHSAVGSLQVALKEYTDGYK